MWVHSTLFSCTGQDGELAAIVGVVLRADRYVVRLAEDPVAPANKTRLSARPVPALHPRTTEGFGQNAAVGPPRCTELGSWGPSPSKGWWVPIRFFSITRVWVSSYPFFFLFIDVFPRFDFLRQVLWPVHLCLCPRRARLNWAARFKVPTCSCWFYW